MERLDKGKWLRLNYRFQPLFMDITSTRMNGCQKLLILSAADKKSMMNMTGWTGGVSAPLELDSSILEETNVCYKYHLLFQPHVEQGDETLK